MLFKDILLGTIILMSGIAVLKIIIDEVKNWIQSRRDRQELIRLSKELTKFYAAAMGDGILGIHPNTKCETKTNIDPNSQNPKLTTVALYGFAIELYALGDSPTMEDALKLAEGWFESVEDSQRHHGGDCTHQPYTCKTCIVEKWEDWAKEEFSGLEYTKHWGE